MNELAPLDAALDGLIARLSPTSRRQLARTIATDLRSSQAKRIADQKNPDGTSYEPRKPRLRNKRGSIRRQMFGKLRTARWLKTEATPNGATVTFANQVQRMAQVHQFGLRDKISRKSSAETRYPQRQLLGITPSEEQKISDTVIDWLAS